MIENQINYNARTLGKVKFDIYSTRIETISDQNRISFLLTLDINNAAPLVCYGYEAYLNYHQQEIESFHKLANFDFSSEYNINFISKFKIQNNILKEIESKRDKDIEFALKVDFFLIQKEYVNIQNKKNIDLLKSYPQLISTTLIIKFPQSFWIENIINKSTLHKIALLELPLADYPKLDTLSISIKEPREAKKYFINKDYDKVVSHCRSVLESVTNQKLKLEEKIKSKSNYKAFVNINAITTNWLDQITKEIQNISNKSHHPPSFGHFSKEESEAILLICLSIVKFWCDQIKNFEEI